MALVQALALVVAVLVLVLAMVAVLMDKILPALRLAGYHSFWTPCKSRIEPIIMVHGILKESRLTDLAHKGISQK